MRVVCYTSSMSIEGAHEKKASSPDYGHLVLSSREYVRHPWVMRGGERAYAYALESAGKKLSVYGSEHIHDPEDPLYKEMDAAFEATDPDMVYVEGMEGINVDPETVRSRVEKMSEEDAKKLGENMYALKLAVAKGAAFESPEPSHAEEIKHLERMGFPREIIYGQTFYRSVVQFQRTYDSTRRAAFDEYYAPYRARFVTDSGWDASEVAAIEAALSSNLDLTDRESYRKLLDPMPWSGKDESTFNSLSSVSSEYRDQYILRRIAEGLTHHDRLFVVYGSGHAVTLEPALRALMEHLPPQSASE